MTNEFKAYEPIPIDGNEPPINLLLKTDKKLSLAEWNAKQMDIVNSEEFQTLATKNLGHKPANMNEAFMHYCDLKLNDKFRELNGHLRIN